MSKQQVDLKLNLSILLLGVLMANFWGSVVQASNPTELTEEEEHSPLKHQDTLSPSDISGVRALDDDEAALNWVKNDALGIAKYLYKHGVNNVTYEAIAEAFMQMRNQSLDKQMVVNDDIKMYMQGAVQAFLDNMRSKQVVDADQRGVDAWLHAHAGDIIKYLQLKNTTSIRNYAEIVSACSDLNIKPLATKRVAIQQQILDSINNSLKGETGLLSEDDEHLPAILSKLRSEGAMNVNKKRFIQTAQNLNLPKEFIARLKAIPERMMEQVLEKLNAELSVKHDPMIVGRALGVIAQTKQSRTVSVGSAIDVIRAVAKQKSSKKDESDMSKTLSDGEKASRAIDVVHNVSKQLLNMM